MHALSHKLRYRGGAAEIRLAVGADHHHPRMLDLYLMLH
jgi:hypothetical protein